MYNVTWVDKISVQIKIMIKHNVDVSNYFYSHFKDKFKDEMHKSEEMEGFSETWSIIWKEKYSKMRQKM